MLGDVPRYARHVRWLPCKDITIGAQKVGELAFLFGRELAPILRRLGRVSGVNPTDLAKMVQIRTQLPAK